MMISLQNLGVKYRIGNRRADLKSHALDRILHRHVKEDVWALRGLDLMCGPGEIIGVIGANGAGKTTFCRVIAGLLRADEGRALIRGSVSALFSLGIGFRRDLTGRENIFLNGMMLGFKKKELAALTDDIIQFTELGDFIDQSIKRYSSGMRARLAFSISAMMTPDILVLDEALSAGDLRFSDKAGEKLQELMGQSKLVMIVTHNLDFVDSYCNRAVWIEGGRVRSDGNPANITSLYREQNGLDPKKKKRIQFSESSVSIGSVKMARVKGLGVRYKLDGLSLFRKKCVCKQSNHPVPDGGQGKESPLGLSLSIGSRDRVIWALKDVSFSLREGEILGIIGPNGAGKSTLCRALCGILKPDSGTVSIYGRVTALLTYQAGFKLDLSGKDNIYLNGLMLGLTRNQVDNLFVDIVAFSGIKKNYIDQPIKYYSKGMRARLGFSIASMIKPDIFILDEALNAGDVSFYEKARVKIQDLIREAKATLIVTHNTNFIEKVCTRAILLDKGRILYDGSPKKAVSIYRTSVRKPMMQKVKVA